jgi:hypothetical protein
MNVTLASRRIVAAMKRTNRGKDWPFVTALGIRMLDAGLPEGWLHLYDAGVIRDQLSRCTPPEEIVARRPALRLALARRTLPLHDAHAIRLECAGRTLSADPIREYGASRLLDDARDATARLVHPTLVEWLPKFGTGIILPPQ